MRTLMRGARISMRYGCVVLLSAGLGFVQAQGMPTPLAAQAPGAPSTAAEQGSPQRGRLIAKDKCAACHGLDGNAPTTQFAKLAGQNPVYMERQLSNFRSAGAKGSPVMMAVARTLSAQEISDVIAYYARQQLRPDPPTHSSLAAEGRQIVLMGLRGRVPSCAMCHRADVRGTPPMMGGMMGGRMGHMMGGMMGPFRMSAADARAVPRIAGQHASFLVDQLNRFAQGKRPNPLMETIAKRLDSGQRAAVAAYLAEMPPP